MTKLKRWLCLVLTLALSTALILPTHAVDPLANSFAAFLISAENTDSPEVNLQVDLYRRDSAGTFGVDDSVRYSCSINRTAGQASFLIQPQADNVWVEVDYLTDLNGDGIYEMLDGQDSPVCDIMTTGGQLQPWNGTSDPWLSTEYALTQGQTYYLSAKTLQARGQAVLKARATSGNSQALPLSPASSTGTDTTLYFVSVHYLSSVDHEEYAQGYYLRLFDSVIVPSDVPVGSWYYDAVEYVLEQGFFSGTGDDSFSPTQPMTRAMLWTVLARLDGQSLSGGSLWYSAAQSWAMEQGISDGSNPNGSITREQLALMLYNLANPKTGTSGQNLTGFSDASKISSWAVQAVNWAVGQGILSGKGSGILDPKGNATRAEVAAMLRQYVSTVQ